MSLWNADTWKGKKVTIAGLGAFGGQVAAATFFARLGADVTVTDKKSADDLAEGIALLEGLDVRLVFGGHCEEDFTSADLVVASPAIPEESPYLAAAEAACVQITHEMDIFFLLCRAPIIGVTGSNGKSTTAALLAHLLEHSLTGDRDLPPRRVWLGGNIGRSLLPDVSDITPDDIVVLELSSFQLEDLGALAVSPHGAVVTNLSPNHLDRHKTFENYAAAKRHITLHQASGDFLVLNADDANLATWAQTGAKVTFFGTFAPNRPDGVYVSGSSLVFISEGESRTVAVPGGWKLIGRHNLLNLAAACAAAVELDAVAENALLAAQSFKPLPHRLEPVGQIEGVVFYNDSIATTPESVKVALESFEAPIVLIAGGYDKGLDLSGLARKAAVTVKALVAVGATAETIAAAATRARPALTVFKPASFEEAVRAAFAAAAPGDVVLLSPGCASYDLFANFRVRGDTFRRIVAKLKERQGELQ